MLQVHSQHVSQPLCHHVLLCDDCDEMNEGGSIQNCVGRYDTFM